MANGAASSVTDASPRASRDRMALRVGSDRAANVLSSVWDEYLTIRLSIMMHLVCVKPKNAPVVGRARREELPEKNVSGRSQGRPAGPYAYTVFSGDGRRA